MTLFLKAWWGVDGNWNMNNSRHEWPCWSSPGSITQTIARVSDHVLSSPEIGTRIPTGMSDHVQSSQGTWTPIGMRDHVGPHRDFEHEHERTRTTTWPSTRIGTQTDMSDHVWPSSRTEHVYKKCYVGHCMYKECCYFEFSLCFLLSLSLSLSLSCV